VLSTLEDHMHRQITAVAGVASGIFGAATTMAVALGADDDRVVRGDVFAVLLGMTVLTGIVSLDGWITTLAVRSAVRDIAAEERAATEAALAANNKCIRQAVVDTFQAEFVPVLRVEIDRAVDEALRSGIVYGAQKLEATVTPLHGGR
jgi:hypothetical protein